MDDVFHVVPLIGAGLAGLGVGFGTSNYRRKYREVQILSVLMINKYRNASLRKSNLYLNIGIVLSSYLSVGSIEKLVYSIVVMFAYTFISDIIIDGFKQTFQFLVFSSKNKEIAEKINSEIHRGATFIKGYGYIVKKRVDILLIIAHRTDQGKYHSITNKSSTHLLVFQRLNKCIRKEFEQLSLIFVLFTGNRRIGRFN